MSIARRSGVFPEWFWTMLRSGTIFSSTAFMSWAAIVIVKHLARRACASSSGITSSAMTEGVVWPSSILPRTKRIASGTTTVRQSL